MNLVIIRYIDVLQVNNLCNLLPCQGCFHLSIKEEEPLYFFRRVVGWKVQGRFWTGVKGGSGSITRS